MIDFVTSWMSRLLVKPFIARTDQPKDVSIAASQAVVIGDSRGIAGGRGVMVDVQACAVCDWLSLPVKRKVLCG